MSTREKRLRQHESVKILRPYPIHLKSKPSLKEIEEDFIEYISYTRQCKTISVYRENDTGLMGLSTSDYMNRWAEAYKNRYLKKLHQLQDWYNKDPLPVTFITFTTKHKRTDFIPDQVTILKEYFTRIKDLIRKRKGKFSYIGNMDFHKTGHAHYHYIFFVKLNDNDIDYIKKIWSEKYGIGSYERGIHFDAVPADRLNFVVTYIFRHSAKLFDEKFEAPGSLKFHSCVRYMFLSDKYKGVRYINCSRDISKIMKLEDNNEFETLCTYQSHKNNKGMKVYTKSKDEINAINCYLDYLISC